MGVRTSVKFNYKGNELTLYYIGAVCEATGRNVQTIRNWEKFGIIPKTPFKDKLGRRLYLQEHIDAIADCAGRCNISQGKAMSRTSFRTQVHSCFQQINQKYGIGVKKRET